MSVRVWFARDTGFTADPKIQVLGDEHGPGGPLVVEELLALAKLANKDGAVRISYKALARRAFITPAQAKRIVADAAAWEVLEVSECDGHTLVAGFPKWARWQLKDPTAAERQSRRRHANVTQDVTP